MCHFHSVVIDRQGRVYHQPSNSHSGIAEHYGLKNGPDFREFFECEWDGIGQMPVNLVRDRDYGADYGTAAPSVVQRAAERHYEKLVKVLSGELPADTAPFGEPEYADVPAEIERHKAETARLERMRIEREQREAEQREREAEAQAARELADKVLAIVESQTDCMEAHELDAFVRQIADELNREIGDVFSDELELERREAHDAGESEGEERGREDGYEAASVDLYSWDYMQEEIDSAVAQAKEEWESERLGDSVVYAAGYAEGFAAAGRGGPATIDNAVAAYLVSTTQF